MSNDPHGAPAEPPVPATPLAPQPYDLTPPRDLTGHQFDLPPGPDVAPQKRRLSPWARQRPSSSDDATRTRARWEAGLHGTYSGTPGSIQPGTPAGRPNAPAGPHAQGTPAPSPGWPIA